MELNCEDCERNFATPYTLRRHLKRTHNILELTKNPKQLSKCLSCMDNITFSKISMLIDHLNTEHGMSINEEILNFSNSSEFQSWLNEYELEHKCEYVLKTGKKKCVGGHRSYYDCCRTGVYEKPDNIKRKVKIQGSKKININCTSHIVLFEPFNQSNCTVTFYKQHYGHEENELQHIRIPTIKRNEIAAKLSKGIKVSELLHEIKDNIGPNLNRIDKVTRFDLHNFIKKYNIKIQKDDKEEEFTNFDNWIEVMKGKGAKNPVIYYKKQGEVDATNTLDTADFCLILMYPDQVRMIKESGPGKLMCIDNIHSDDSNDYDLITLMFADDFSLVFPCSFMFINSNDTKMYSIMFSIIKNNVGTINPEIILTNQMEAIYSAWKNIMGPVPNTGLYSWYVDSVWKQNICKIIGPKYKEKQDTAYKSLKIMQSFADQNEFHKAWKEFYDNLINDPDTKDFVTYFEQKYGSTINTWAYCHWKDKKVNVHLESIHRTIIHHYLKGCKTEQLAKIITTIRRYTHNQIIKVTKERLTLTQEIEKTHKESTLLDHTIIIQDDVNNWSVESEHVSNQFYKIRKINDEVCCAMKCSACKLCIHTFNCTCPDYQIKSKICQHIHMVALKVISLENYVGNTSIPSDYNLDMTMKDVKYEFFF